MIQGGQKLLVTGRTEDGAWLRIHFPEPGPERGLGPGDRRSRCDGAVASLPGRRVPPELADRVAVDRAGRRASPRSPNNPPSAPPAESPEPGPVADARAHAHARCRTRSRRSPRLTVSTRKISYDTGDYCPNAVKRVTFRVKAGDADGRRGRHAVLARARGRRRSRRRR